jgi:hypothetical protein
MESGKRNRTKFQRKLYSQRMSTNGSGWRDIITRILRRGSGLFRTFPKKEIEFKRSFENGMGWQRSMHERNYKLMSLV